MRDEIVDLLPEVKEIRDESLREKVIDVWEDAITTGGWRPKELMEIPFTLLAGETKMLFIEHIRSIPRRVDDLGDDASRRDLEHVVAVPRRHMDVA